MLGFIKNDMAVIAESGFILIECWKNDNPDSEIFCLTIIMSFRNFEENIYELELYNFWKKQYFALTKDGILQLAVN